MNELTKLAWICNAERRTITEEETKNITRYIVDKQGYNVKHIIIGDSIKNILGGEVQDRLKETTGIYDPKEKAIIYFHDNMLNHNEEGADLVQKEYNIDGGFYDIMNFFALTCIIHEIAHARQDTIKEKSHDCIEKKLFNIFMSFKKSDPFYQENYNILPTEANAENVAYVNAYNIFSKMPYHFFSANDRISFQLITLKRLLYSNYQLYGKDDSVYGPTELIGDSLNNEILKPFNLDIEKYAKLIYSTKDLTLYKKLMLGLPITVSEYAYANLLVDRLAAGEEFNAIKKLQKRM